jgi:pimeloyl-ACP methyl ester carboxylesterase
MTMNPHPGSTMGESHRLIRDPSLPIWRELGAWMEWIELRRSAVYRGIGVPRGKGECVILVPGFLGSETSLSELRRWLVRIGYRVCSSGIDRNADCPDVSLARLLEATEAAFELGRAPVRLVGHSLGGTLSRAAAVKRPDLIQQIITLGSPLREVIAHPLVVSVAEFIESRLPAPDERPRRHGDHFHGGDCSCQTIEALARPFPQGVQRTAIYTRQDGIIDWRTAQEELAEYNIEVRGTHLGLVVNREVYKSIGQLLATGNPPKSDTKDAPDESGMER